ncbi:MAG: hypothetical protein ACI4E1_09530 [Lachnospira sp.]
MNISYLLQMMILHRLCIIRIVSRSGFGLTVQCNYICGQAKDRREYKQITKNIAQLIKWKGNDTAKSIIEELKQRYSRRPALLDKLEKVEKKM